MECRRAAWQCGSYVVFVARQQRGDGVTTVPISNETHSADPQEYGIDIDRDGTPVGVELLHRACYDD